MEIVQIPVDQIREDTDQPRRQQSEESLQGLADSIRQHGLLHPITITPVPASDAYRIVTGERRWRAARMARLQTIPCIVKLVDGEDRLTEQLIENLQREDLLPLEKARAIDHVKTNLRLTNRETARRLGLSERSVGYLLDLLELPEEIGQAVVSSPNRPSDGQLTEKHARFLKQLGDDAGLQEAVVERIRADKLNTEETGQLVRAIRSRPEQIEEILSSPMDHLDTFFRESPTPEREQDEPARIVQEESALAAAVLAFLPALAGFDPSTRSHAELGQIEDALTSLHMAVESLLQSCRQAIRS